MNRTITLLAALAVSGIASANFTGLQELKYFRNFERFTSLSDFENASSRNSLIGFHSWAGDTKTYNLVGRHAKPMGENAVVEFRFGVSNAQISTADSNSLGRSFNTLEEGTGFLLGIGYSSQVPLAEGIRWGADFDFVKLPGGDLGMSPSLGLSWMPSVAMGDFTPILEGVLSYDYIDPDNQDSDSALGSSLGLTLKHNMGFEVSYFWGPPSKLDTDNNLFRVAFALPNHPVKAFFAYGKGDVRYAGLTFNF